MAEEFKCTENDVVTRSRKFRSFLSRRRIKYLLASPNLQIQVPTSESPESKPSPKSFMESPDFASEYNPTLSKSHIRGDFSVNPYVIGDLSEEYVLSPVEIGRGRYGVVKECVHESTGEIMACKSIDKTQLNAKGKRTKALHLEVKLALALPNHPNIVKFNRVIEDDKYVHFIMEKYRGCDLFDLILRKGRLSEKESATIFRKIGEAVFFIHSKGILHRDIKPENIMLNNLIEMEPKLGDFGEAFVMSYGKYPRGMAGSPPYMAPEIILGLPYGFAADVWSLGILLYIMLSGLLPFHAATPIQTFKCILNYEPNFSVPPWDTISFGARNLVRGMLTRDPNKRLNLKQVLSNSWIQFITDKGCHHQHHRDSSIYYDYDI